MSLIHRQVAKPSFPQALLLAVLAIVSTGCNPLWGDGIRVTEQRPIGAFKRLQVSEGVHATFVPGPPSLEIEADSNLIGEIQTVMEGDTLIIRFLEPGLVYSAGGLQARVAGEELLEASAQEGGRIHLTAPTSQPEAMTLRASEGAHLTAIGINVTQLELEVASGSGLLVEGTAKDERVRASASSVLRAEGLQAENVEVDGASGSRLWVRATQSVRGTIQGGASMVVLGNPPSRDVRGSSDPVVSYP